MKNFLFSFFIFLLSFACQSQQSPSFQVQNRESLFKFLETNNISFDKKDVAVLKDMKTFTVYNANDMLTVPEAYFFNNQGQRVKGFKGVACGQAIQNLEKINKKASDKKDTINKWFDNFTFLESPKDSFTDYDFYVIINWATFLPEENKISFNWYQSLKENKQHKIKIVLLSLDIQDNWALNDAQKKH